MEEAMKRDKLGQTMSQVQSTSGKCSLKWIGHVAPAPSQALGRQEVSSSV